MKRNKKLIQKRENQEKIAQLAQSIMSLEKDIQMGKNIKDSESKIQIIADSLSLEEMLMIDEYIMKNI